LMTEMHSVKKRIRAMDEKNSAWTKGKKGMVGSSSWVRIKGSLMKGENWETARLFKREPLGGKKRCREHRRKKKIKEGRELAQVNSVGRKNRVPEQEREKGRSERCSDGVEGAAYRKGASPENRSEAWGRCGPQLKEGGKVNIS